MTKNDLISAIAEKGGYSKKGSRAGTCGCNRNYHRGTCKGRKGIYRRFWCI
ncbi:MAG: hypothetical protein ACLR47_10560 [Ruminococcus bicirculans (ex Wegman et al. 2014)]|uniref:hypothetical protein n=1 Tax=Ruminococcus bicirculans (ex Wegman et al. 2014) TaxID=1160721 RepID=UPI0039A18A90